MMDTREHLHGLTADDLSVWFPAKVVDSANRRAREKKDWGGRWGWRKTAVGVAIPAPTTRVRACACVCAT